LHLSVAKYSLPLLIAIQKKAGYLHLAFLQFHKAGVSAKNSPLDDRQEHKCAAEEENRRSAVGGIDGGAGDSCPLFKSVIVVKRGG
jgi:hypothetical protein